MLAPALVPATLILYDVRVQASQPKPKHTYYGPGAEDKSACSGSVLATHVLPNVLVPPPGPEPVVLVQIPVWDSFPSQVTCSRGGGARAQTSGVFI